jgi:hypothetical protein
VIFEKNTQDTYAPDGFRQETSEEAEHALRIHSPAVRPHAHHDAMQAARQRQETPALNAQYALRSGVESRSRGLARTHLQHLLTATAMTIVRVIAWLQGDPFGERRQPRDTVRG